MSADIFVSYDRDDQDRVQQIVERLEDQGYTVWWDVDLRGGQDYRRRIKEVLNSVRCVVVVWSRLSVDSHFVPEEAEIGRRRNILLPVVIDEGIEPPIGFLGIHARDLSGWTGRSTERVFKAFLNDVADVIAGAPMRRADPPSAPAGWVPAPSQPPRATVLEPGPAPTPAAPQPRAASAGKPSRRPLVIGGAILLAGILYLASPDPDGPDDSGRRAAADTAAESYDPASNAPVDPTAAAASGSLAAVLGNRRCLLRSPPGTPIERRVLAVTPLPFRVDTATHLLTDQNGQPVPGAEPGSSGAPRIRRAIVAHFTGREGESHPRTQDGRGSVHLLIGRDGTVRQQLPLDQASLHAGPGSNSLESIGIGMENQGALVRVGNAWHSGATPMPTEAAVVVDGRGWHRYTDAQVRAFFQVSCALRQAYPTIGQLVGHGDWSITPRVEPGPAFPLDSMRARLFPQ